MTPIRARFAAALLLSACLCTPVLAAEPYKIGALFAVSGPASMLGGPEKNSAEMLVDQINHAGGIGGTPVELTVYDTEGDNTKAVMNAKKLAEKDAVLAIVGPTTSGGALAALEQAEKSEVPLVACASSFKIVTPVRKWVFKVTHSDVLVVESIFRKLQKEGKKKIALISVSDGFGDSGRSELLRVAPDFGLSVVADERYGASDTDMSTQLTKIKGTDAEALICWGTNPGPAIIAKNRKQLGMAIPLYESHGVASKKFIELAGDAAEGIMLPVGKIVVADQISGSDPQKKVLVGYKKAYEERFPKEQVSTFGGHGFDSVLLVTEAMRRIVAGGGSVTRDSIRAELERTKGVPGIAGMFNMDPADHNGLTPDGLVMVRIEKGDWKVIAD
jgi:branched-chain amino acid transport system substrate-binding protein